MALKMLGVVGLGILGMAVSAQADVANFLFNGPGVSGQGTITYTVGSGGADQITDISGVFSDTNPGMNGKPAIVNASITGLYGINPVNPLPAEVFAPDFSQYSIVNGVPPEGGGPASPALSYDNTYYPAGSPVVCGDYPGSGGVFDVYGVMFTISTGQVVGLWSNGQIPGAPTDPAPYGVAVADATNTYDYVGGVTLVPEPVVGMMGMVGVGLVMMRRRKGSSVA
ncbi:MAG TPA: hypothetical protein VFE58_16900 [Tepidisphaeraceae bacterium]|jgi:hypothetical protein|nr:hypothetical protein [Tepidisphaeraceae bacterium]